MIKKCSNPECTAPKGLCDESLDREYQQCPFWNVDGEKKDEKIPNTKNGKTSLIPWSGLALQPKDIEILSHRSTPLIIGMIGAPNAGKTSYLGMIYTLLFNGKKLEGWGFVGSQTLIAWETLAKFLKIKPNGKADFAPPTPSNPDYYSLYHFALRNQENLCDILFADSSGEVFTLWSNDINDVNASNARWISEKSDAFIFFIDCEALIERRGPAKRDIVQMAGQLSAGVGERPVVVVWSKSDRIDEIRPNIKNAVTEAMQDCFPNSETIMISNFSKDDPDVLCHKNNLRVTEDLLKKLNKPKEIDLIPEIGDTTDLFFKYRGNYGS
jgi:hypothetical protein